MTSVLTLQNDTSRRLRAKVYLPGRYCRARGILSQNIAKGEGFDSVINLAGKSPWTLDTVERSDNEGITVQVREYEP